MGDEEMTEANEYSLCGMYLERNPTPDSSLAEAQHVQEEMRDNWEVDLGFSAAVDILMEHNVLVPPTEWEEDEDDEVCIHCVMRNMMTYMVDLEERITELEEEK